MKTSDLIRELVDSLTHFGDLPIRGVNDKEIKISWYCPSEGGDFEAITLYETGNEENIEDYEVFTENKKIEKIKVDNENRIQAPSTGNYAYTLSQPMKILANKLNELIDEINKLKEDK